MLSNRSVWASRSHPLFAPDGSEGGSSNGNGDGNGGSDSAKTGAEGEKKDGDEQLGEAGKAALHKEREARQAAEKEAKRLKKLVDDAEAATKQREADEAAAKGEFEKLANARQEEIDRLKADLAERDRSALRMKVGAAHKLPDPLIELLKGETEADLTAHAKELAKHVKPPTAADTEAGSGQRGGNGGLSNRQGERAKKDGEQTPSFAFMPARSVPIPQ